jgi:3-methyladenine DNA glycosylase/8-oxoguanine DNA glycosylase
MNEYLVLNQSRDIEIAPAAPFSFDPTMHKPDHFPASDNAWEPGVRWQTMLWGGTPLGLRFKNERSVEQPLISLSIRSHRELSDSVIDDLLSELEYRYRFQFDLTDFYERFGGDVQLGPIIERWRGMRPLNHNSLYEYLIIAIVLQNATVRRSVSMMQALFENYGTPLAFDDKLFYCFWEPKDVHRTTEEDLRALKVGYRAKSIKRVTSSFVEGEVDEFELRKQSKEQQREALLGLYGIGPASVGYILVDVFHHLDELSHISPWEQKIYSKLFFNGDPDDPVPVDLLLKTIDERYGAYKMLAVHYIWEDLFWRRRNQSVPWLEELIRL